MVLYEGIFFEGESAELIHSLESEQLDKVKDKLHCTFKFLPRKEEIFNEIVGKSFEVLLIGYGNDGANSGFQIQLPDELKPYYISYDKRNPGTLRTPHITTSLKEGARAYNTSNLEFKLLEKPVKVVGKFGYWIRNKNGEYVSYKPFYINFKK